jgi:hypothetical protein
MLTAYRFDLLWGGGPRGKPSTQEDLTPITGKLLSDSRPFGW